MAVESINTIKSYLTEGKYPTASELVNVLDTLVSIGQNSGGDTSGLADVAISGDYNDLTNKPTIPTVPTISTNIANDATSDTKTTSPKAVKDFVEGKGYLTQHQDISGKADQTDLEALEDRVETLEQSGGSAAQYSYLELVPDLDAYTDASIGKIVKYTGQSNNKYTRGWDYEKVSDTPQSRAVTSIVYTDDVIEVLKQAIDSLTFPLSYDNEEVPVYYFSAGSTSSPERFASVGTKTPAIGDPIFACDGSAVYHVTNTSTSGSKYYINIDHPTRTSSYELNLNKTFFKWHDSNGNTVLLRHSIGGSGGSGSGYRLIKEDVFIEKDNMMYFGSDNDKTQAVYDDLQISLWQPVLMPSSIQTDVELSSSSHYPVENATLYDELRVEEAGSVLSVNGTNYPIVELDANNFDTVNWTGGGDTDFAMKVIPTLDSTKAYIIRNANWSESNCCYSFSNQGTFILKFLPDLEDVELNSGTSLLIGHNDADASNYYYITESAEWSQWLSIPATTQFNVSDWGGWDNDTTIPYYGTSYEDGGSSTITELTNATETTGSASVIKSLKVKVMELEAQIAQISAQLQNIASN